jgi:hypothetical protein
MNISTIYQITPQSQTPIDAAGVDAINYCGYGFWAGGIVTPVFTKINEEMTGYYRQYDFNTSSFIAPESYYNFITHTGYGPNSQNLLDLYSDVLQSGTGGPYTLSGHLMVDNPSDYISGTGSFINYGYANFFKENEACPMGTNSPGFYSVSQSSTSFTGSCASFFVFNNFGVHTGSYDSLSTSHNERKCNLIDLRSSQVNTVNYSCLTNILPDVTKINECSYQFSADIITGNTGTSANNFVNYNTTENYLALVADPKNNCSIFLKTGNITNLDINNNADPNNVQYNDYYYYSNSGEVKITGDFPSINNAYTKLVKNKLYIVSLDSQLIQNENQLASIAVYTIDNTGNITKSAQDKKVKTMSLKINSSLVGTVHSASYN